MAEFQAAFSTTPVQVRYPHPSAVAAGFGLHDDSFAHSTLDGDANGGTSVGWFFWPQVLASGYADFWKDAVMGGEVRPELQPSVFSDTYAVGTYSQDLDLCVETTHATYMLNYHAFATGYAGADLERARASGDGMGYAFVVAGAAAAAGPPRFVDVALTVEQAGVAPFYYPLELRLGCPGGFDGNLPGVEGIVGQGDAKTFVFADVPATPECLGDLAASLSSPFAYATNPIRFAQGVDGATVRFGLPLPPAPPSPTDPPTNGPTRGPTDGPTHDPTEGPTDGPTSSPTNGPPPPPAPTGCPVKCTRTKDCYGNGATGAKKRCGEISCDAASGLCSYNAWVESCPTFLTCGGDDDVNGPDGSTGTCTGWQNDECVYEFCPACLKRRSFCAADSDCCSGWCKDSGRCD